MRNTSASASSLGGVAETSLIPLYFRALESREANPIVVDPAAVAIVERLHYDFSTIDTSGPDRVFAMMRARQFDRCARAFLTGHPCATVVDLGCGLDTRFGRVDNGTMRWCGIDLPAVVDCRRALLHDGDRCRVLSSSILDFTWMDQVRGDLDGPPLVMAEGVFVYLGAGQVRALVAALAKTFPGSQLVFDAMSPLFVWIHNRQAILKRVDVRLGWGLARAGELETWGPNIRLLDCWSYFDDPEPRLGRLAWLRRVPGVRHGNLVVRYQLGEER